MKLGTLFIFIMYMAAKLLPQTWPLVFFVGSLLPHGVYDTCTFLQVSFMYDKKKKTPIWGEHISLAMTVYLQSIEICIEGSHLEERLTSGKNAHIVLLSCSMMFFEVRKSQRRKGYRHTCTR